MCSSRVSKPTGMSGSRGTDSGLSARRWGAALRGRFRGAHLCHLEAFQDIANLHIIEIGDARAALEPGAHFAGIVLEALQRTELGGVHLQAEEHTSELQSPKDLVCRLLLEKKKIRNMTPGMAKIWASMVARSTSRPERR